MIQRLEVYGYTIQTVISSLPNYSLHAIRLYIEELTDDKHLRKENIQFLYML